MNKKTIVDLIAYTTQLNPAQRFDEYTPVAWHDVLGDLDATFEQCREAVARVARTECWIYPSAIREELKTILRAAKPAQPAAAITQRRAWDQCQDRPERVARGMATVRPVLEAIEAKRIAADPHEADISESLRRAREVARQYRRERNARPESQARPLAGAVGSDPAAIVAKFKQIPERSVDEPFNS